MARVFRKTRVKDVVNSLSPLQFLCDASGVLAMPFHTYG
jgi:hypothetical protein